MPINPSNLMSQLSPMAPLGPVTFGDDEKTGQQREHMKLLREQFEETKRRNLVEEQMKRMQQESALQREQMISDRAAAKAQAKAQADMDKRKQDAFAKFTELNGKGQIEEARAMVPMLHELGMQVDLEGEDAGLPRYRIHMSPEEAAADAADTSLGYPQDDSGVMSPPAGIPSTADAFGQALQASAQAKQTGMPARPPDEPDYTGAVPKNVIDVGANHALTLATLNPALAGMVMAYPDAGGNDPDAYRRSAAQTATGIAGMPGSGADALKAFEQARTSPDSLIRANIDAEAKAGEQGVKREDAAAKEAQKNFKSGMAYGKTIGAEFDLEGIKARRRQLTQAASVLGNDSDADDYLAGAAVSRLMGERGATTEGDIQRALGTASMSFIEQIKSGFYQKAIGGLSLPQRDALSGILRKAQETDERSVNDFLDNLDEQMASPDTHPDVAKGLKAYRNMAVTKDLRDKHDGKKKAATGAAPMRGTPVGFNMEDDSKREYATNGGDDWEGELKKQADANGLNFDAMRRVVMYESGGKPNKPNSEDSGAMGLIQFMPDIAKQMGTTTEELSKMSAADQVQYVTQYFKERGLTKDQSAEDYYLATAAGDPKWQGMPDDTVVYKKGTKEWTKNRPWRPADGGDITIGSIKDVMRKQGGAAPEQKADPAARVKELLLKGGY